jgi:uncharacterized protein YuzE
MRISARKNSERSKLEVVSPPAGEHGNGLFEAFVCEFHWTALQIAAVTCCVNASAARNRAWMLRACCNLIPVESSVIRSSLNSWEEIGLPKKLASSLQEIFIDLSDAKVQTLPIVRDAGTFSETQVSAAKLEQMAILWRELAQACEAVLLVLEPEARWRLSGLYTGNCLVLGRFLRDAISGAHDCVNQFGEVAIPVLPQRRKLAHHALLQPCMLRGANGAVAAFAQDFSKCGMNLSCERNFELKERVFIELRSGRKIRGIVVWSRNNRLNVQFDEPLAGTDPLFMR